MRRAFAHQTHLAALVVRYVHAGLSFVLLLVALGLFFGSHGSIRRGLWEDFGTLLGANGLASVVGIPILIALTAYWRRAQERPFAWIEHDAATREVKIGVGRGDVRRIACDDVVATYVEELPGDVRRVVLTMRGRIGDRYALVLPEGEAAELVAFVGRRPQAFDVGVRSMGAAGWSFSLAYAAACVVALVGSTWLRPHVPRMVFEPFAITESVGWILGFGVAAFGPAHAWLGLFMQLPSVAIGVDGFSVKRRGRTRFWAWSSLITARRDGARIDLGLADGTQARIRLWPMEPHRVERLVRLVQERADAAQAERARTPAEEAEQAPRKDAYRVQALDDAELGARLVSSSVPRERRLRIAHRLAAQGAPGRATVRAAASEIADPDLRGALEALAEIEATEAEPSPRTSSRAASASERDPR